MSGSPPTTLGKYQIIREIARSNDIVYEAYDSLMNRRVALKELAMPGGSTPQQREDRIKRFLREARAAGSLAHPNIMTVYEVGQEADRYFIAMEYLDGKTLRNELDTKGFLPTERAVEIATAVLEGLEYAHGKGVIHRDIKPDNIQLLSSGAIKLTDFGIARLTFEPNLTMDGQVFGTPSYMSPEQVVGRDIDARSDLFSVGVVLYEMLSGTKPFHGDSVVTITYGIMNKNPDRPQQVNWALWQVIEKALDKSPQLRYRSAREFIDALRLALESSKSVVIDPPKPQAPPYIGQPLYSPNAYGSSQPQQQHIYQQQNVYGQPVGQPAANPYSNQPPIIQHPYTPGVGAQPMAHQPIMQQGPASVPPMYGNPIPVYYPPPPRRPLIKISPQTRQFLATLFVYMVALAAIAGLIIVGYNSLSTAVDREVAQRTKDPAGRAAASSDPADDWNSRGLAAENSGDYAEAVRDFSQGIALSPKNPAGYLNLADLFILEEQTTDSAEDDKRDHLRRGAEDYEVSASLQPDAGKRDSTNRKAAQAWLDLGKKLKDAGFVDDGRRALDNALRDSDSDADLHQQITDLIQKWSGT